MRTFRKRATHFDSLCSVFLQAQFVGFEDIILETPRVVQPHVVAFPTLTLQFSLAGPNSRLELARVLYIFKRIFNVKPFIRHGRPDGYRLFADFPAPYAVHLLGFFMRLRSNTRTKFLRFFFSENTPDFQFLLLEPITFFPLIHPGFDYHDWSYPFAFFVRFKALSGMQWSYLMEATRGVFDV